MIGVVPQTPELRLALTIGEARRKEFVRGQHDCANFAIDCEKAITGTTLFPEFDKTYTTRAEGFRIIKRLGFKSFWAVCDARLEMVDLADIRRGDLCGIYAPDESVGIVTNPHEFVTARKPSGLDLRPISEAHRFWRFPHGR